MFGFLLLPRFTLSFLLLSLSSVWVSLAAQSFDALEHLRGNSIDTYYSDDSRPQAEAMTTRCDQVMAYYAPLIQFEPRVTLLVLSPEDWPTYTSFPVYGMPHYNDHQTLIVASENNEFWKSFIPPLDQLPVELAVTIKTTYQDDSGQLSMQGFFDLLAIHELGHAFHGQGGLFMQRKWMGELFANIFLHTYIAEKEPAQLAALTVFPQMVVSSVDIKELKYTTLQELEDHYDELGQRYPNNYGWYQCRWHSAAADIYDAGGASAFQQLWFFLKDQKELLDDTAFADALTLRVHQSVADVLLRWNE